MNDDANKFETTINDCRPIIADNIKNPRDVIRFINLFMPKYEKIKEKVDFSDFLMLSLIRYNYYSEYRDLYEKRFTQETTSKINVTDKNGKTEEQKHRLLTLKKDDEINKILAEKVKDEERRDNLKKILEELFKEKDIYDEKTFLKIKYPKRFKSYFDVFFTNEEANIEKKEDISEAYYNPNLFDGNIFKIRLDNILETNILEDLKRTIGVDSKNEADLRDYLQKLLWINKRKVEQIDRIRDLILNDSDTVKVLRAKINNYVSIILEEFKKNPPLNILADFVNDKENKIILAQNEISEIIKAEMDINMIPMNGFNISRFQVTQELYRVVMGKNPSRFNGHNLPVECVTWYDAVEFCNKLSEKCKLAEYYKLEDIERGNDGQIVKAIVNIKGEKANGYRLPKEEWWKDAAEHCLLDEKKKTTEYAGTNDRNELKNYAWYYENSGDKELDDAKWSADLLSKNNCRTHAVGTAKKADELKIHDMSGNVWEWCEDWYDENRSSRVLRGGSWNDYAQYCRVSNRGNYPPGNRYSSFGFRLALSSI